MMFENNPWKTLSTKEIYENNWIKLKEDQILNPKGNPGIYSVIEFKNIAIGIIALDKDYNTWLVGQFRYPLKQYSWEIPEGGGALNTDPMISAKRELLEETGIEAKKWTKIKEVYISNSCTDEKGILFVARSLTIGEPQPEDDEELQLIKIPFLKAFEMAQNGKITDALSVLGIYEVKLLIDKGAL